MSINLLRYLVSGCSLLLFSFSLLAQTEPVDTAFFNQLDEIVIEAPKVIHKSDMDVYHPSQSAIDNSKNGVQLLSNLMIPSLSVNDALGKITSAGQDVQVRINGREATIEQVRTLLPSTVKRVEWIENPGLRYRGASTVLNFIVVNPSLGGSLMASARPALNVAFGNYMASAKFNFGRSQIEFSGSYKLTQKIKSYRDFSETFTYPDGKSFTRVETPLKGGYLNNSYGDASISYNYIKPDTTVFMANISASFVPDDVEQYRGLMTSTVSHEERLLSEASGASDTSPLISAYWEQHFSNKQLLVVDFKAQYYIGRTFSDYVERSPVNNDLLTDIHTDIKDRNQMYAVEADYIKKWTASTLTTGVYYIANRNRSRYVNLENMIFHQRQDIVYIFSQYLQRINKVTLTAGLGVQYTDFRFRETGLGNSSWNLRPEASVVYSLNQNNQFRLEFDSWQNPPSLAETNPTPQQIDGFQWRIGNPSLKTSNSYMLTFRYNFMLPRVYAQFGVRAFSSPDAVTPVLNWEGDRLVTSYENSRGYKNISIFLAPQIQIVPDWVVLSGYLQWRKDQMKGAGYSLLNSCWSGNGSIMVQHWGFTLTAMYQRAERSLWGESISWGEDINLLDLTYIWKDWSFSAGCIMPFGKYDQGSRSLSKWNTNVKHMRINMRVPYVSISYNLQWGRQKRDASKLINVSGTIDTSKAGGR